MTNPDALSSKQDSSNWETSFPNQIPALMRAIEKLDCCLGDWNADANARYVAQLAVEELGSNIIKYGYDDVGEHTIYLRMDKNESGFRIWLEDDGHPFDPRQTPEPDPSLSLESRTAGGWGLSLVRRLSSGMQYERRDGRNLLCVVVPRDAPLSPP
jgi:anti-sigma regulatory factor (Ser/Thr protein kinase)